MQLNTSGCGVCGVCGTAWQSVTIIVVMAAVRDVERDGGAGRRAAIADRVGKALNPGVALFGFVGVAAVTVSGQLALERIGSIGVDAEGQAGAINITDQIGQIEADAAVFFDCVAGTAGYWRIVHRLLHQSLFSTNGESIHFGYRQHHRPAE